MIALQARSRPTFDRKAIDIYPLNAGNPKFQVKTIHISCQSDPYTGKNHSYGGLIVYAYDGKEGWYTVNGTHCKSGYLVIKDTDCPPTPQAEFPNEPGIVLGAIYRKVFGESYTNKVTGEGFSVKNGEFMTTSRSLLNEGVTGDMSDMHHDNNKSMSATMEGCLKKVVECWKASGPSFTECQNYHVEALLKELKIHDDW